MPGSTATPRFFDAAKITEESRSSLVEISTNFGSGTGFIYRIDDDGKAWILTNEHVVAGGSVVSAELSDGGRRDMTIVGTDAVRDLAVLTICCDGSWKALTTSGESEVGIGSEVAVLGFPGFRIGAGLSVTTGIVSSFGFHDESRAWLIQTDAALNPGNSGGPMLDERGEVVGIVSARVDPIFGENIGFAIAMRTVNEELDALEAGSTVVATPSPDAWYSSDSGTLIHDPNRVGLTCPTNWLNPSVISSFTKNSAAFVKFEIPDDGEWSIGFLYHDIDSLNRSATFIWSDDRRNTFASHWTVSDGNYVHGPITFPISPNATERGYGNENELVFRTSTNGSFIRLNDYVVIEVPRTRLIRKFGQSRICIGFNDNEDESYSINIADIRTRFDRRFSSGLLTADPNTPARVGCPESDDEGAFIYAYATDAWALTDFIIPDVASWSFGFVYHGTGRSHSRTFIGHDGENGYATHVNVVDAHTDEVLTRLVDPRLMKSDSDELNLLEFETTSTGSSLRLNGEIVIEVSASDLRREVGRVELCTRLSTPEDDAYWIRYSDLWAWTTWVFSWRR